MKGLNMNIRKIISGIVLVTIILILPGCRFSASLTYDRPDNESSFKLTTDIGITKAPTTQPSN